MMSLRNATLLFVLTSACAAAVSPLGCSGGDSGVAAPADASIADATDPDAVADSAEAGETGCSEGQPGCACLAGGLCSKGECIKDKCVDCARGADACLCRLNGTCDSGLKCSDGLCAKCTEGTAGCPCGTGGTCDMGLKCSAGTCVADACVAGAVGCGCRAADPRCDASLYCNAGTTCQACSTDVAGCPCTAGACTGLVCDKGSCRKSRTCADLLATGACLANQFCTEATKDVDAVCTPEKCVANYRWDTAAKACVPCGLPDYRWDNTAGACIKCTNASCSAESCGTSTIAATCDSRNRGCTVDVDGKALDCGACKSGYEAPSGGGTTSVCTPKSLCGTAVCSATEYCDRSGTPKCVARKCPVGSAEDKTGLGCISCGALSCTGPGTTGAIWPKVTTADDKCFCEAMDGYFVPSDKSLPDPCDADGDGWVRGNYESINKDPQLTANARCKLGVASAVHLFDEYGAEQIVDSCDSGLIVRTGTATGCPSGEGVVPLRLIEPVFNDGPGLRIDPDAPKFPRITGSTAESVTVPAKLLNGLTKFCAEGADGDFDKQNDVGQAQLLKVGLDNRLKAFSYFAELYTSKYVAPTTGAYGDFYIYERSRCDDAFPFHYNQFIDPAVGGDSYSPTIGATYWRNCQRNRDKDFVSGSASTAGPGFDFAQFSCADASGTCPVVPPAHKSFVAPTDPASYIMQDHGLCNLDKGKAPADKKFRGMNHHSQFKCVSVVTTPVNPYDKPTSDFTSTGPYAFNKCEAAPCTGGGFCEIPSVAGGTGASSSPKVYCKVVAAAGVGWALTKFRPYGPDAVYVDDVYYRGCMNEDAHWQTFTCPFPQFSSSVAGSDTTVKTTYKTRATDNFGRFTCYGDLQNYLWAPEPTPSTPDISTLHWADPSGVVSATYSIDGGTPISYPSILR